jgi:hypothetical protein
LVFNQAPGSHPIAKLFDLEMDPGENIDLSQSRPQAVRNLTKPYQEWFEDVYRPFHPGEVRIGLGYLEDNPTELGRNEYRGPEGKDWQSPTAAGRWDVEITQSGVYSFELEFSKAFEREGIGTV